MTDPIQIADEARLLIQRNQHDAALKLLVRARQKFPKDPELAYRLGVVLMETGRTPEALRLAQDHVRGNPNHYDLNYLLGRAQMANQDHASARQTFLHCSQLEPESPAVWISLSGAQWMLGQADESMASLEHAVQLAPENKDAVVHLNRRRLDFGLCEDALNGMIEAYHRGLRDENFMSLLLLGLHYPHGVSPEEIWEWHQKFGEIMRPRVRELRWDGLRDPDRPLRIGWLTHDFYRHSVTFFLRPILEHLPADEFEHTVYHYPLKTDTTTEELKKKVKRYRLLDRVHVVDLAQMIQNDQIDVLVDLMGHTRLGSFSLFPLRPAPVSISMIGYPDTTGVPGVDYRLVDSITDPPGSERFASETLVRMPECFLCFAPPPDVPEPQQYRTGPMTFGSFNAIFKLNRVVLNTWASILASAPDSRMLIKARGLEVDPIRDRFWAVFRDHGVSPDRVELRGFEADATDHLRLYDEVDLVLDSFPYNGTTTTCEALMMGVPVLATRGAHHASRVSASLLSATGLGEFVCASEDEYQARAVEYARNPASIRQLRSSLPSQFRQCPVCDGPTYARSLANEVRKMWKTFCISHP